MLSFFKKILINVNVVVITLFLWSYTPYNFFSGKDFSINNLDQLYISQATLEDVDVGSRVSYFYILLFSSFVLFPILYIMVLGFFRYLKIDLNKLTASVVISVTGTILIITDIIGPEATQSIHFMALFLLNVLLFTILSRFRKIKFLSNNIFLSSVFIISFLVFGTISMLSKENTFFSINKTWIFFPFTILIAAALLTLKLKFRLFIRKILRFAIPFSLLPIITFIAIEIFIFLILKIDFKLDYRLLIIIFFALSFLFPLFSLKNYSSKKLINSFYAPGALLCFLLLVFYMPVKLQSSEMFELANNANSIMRIFKFGEIPFVDFMSSHMLSDQYYGIVYNFLTGYSGNLDFTVFYFFHFIIVNILIWFFLQDILKNAALTLLFLVTFPFVYILFYPSIFLGIIMYYSIKRVLNNQSVSNYLLFLFLIVILILWRIDTGASSFFASLVFFPLLLYTNKVKFNYRNAFKSLIIFTLTVLLLLLLAFVIRTPEYILENFKSALHYISAHQAHGYANITSNFNQQFYLYHIIFPLFSVCAIWGITYLLRTGNITTNHERNLLGLSLFLFILSLANYQRGLVRHSFWEGSEHFLVSVIFLAFTLFAFSIIKRKNTIGNYITFVSLSFFIIVLLKYFPFTKQKTDFEKLFSENTIYSSLKRIPDLQTRIIPDANLINENYNELTLFLNSNLRADETFLDFSNSPMLYYYCQRRIPSYFCQNLQNSIDDYLQLQHLKWVKRENVPVVIYSHYPPAGIDALDGVPNAMRHYLIAEYIYSNYKPFSVINNRSIWIEKDRSANWENKIQDEIVQMPVTHDYKKAAYIIGRFYLQNNENDLELISIIDDINPEGNMVHLSIDEISGHSGIYAKILLKNQKDDENINVILYNNGSQIANFMFLTSAVDNTYMIRLSNHYLWHASGADIMEINLPENIIIEKVEFYKDNR